MHGWMNLWRCVFLVALGSFTLLVIVGAIGGVSDIFDLFRSLRQQGKDTGDEDTH